MKKTDRFIIFLLIVSNILAWTTLFLTTKKNSSEINLDQESIKKILDTTYIFDHSKIE